MSHFSIERSTQDKIHPRNGRPDTGNDIDSWDGTSESHHPHLLWHDAVWIPLHPELPNGKDVQVQREWGLEGQTKKTGRHSRMIPLLKVTHTTVLHSSKKVCDHPYWRICHHLSSSLGPSVSSCPYWCLYGPNTKSYVKVPWSWNEGLMSLEHFLWKHEDLSLNP